MRCEVCWMTCVLFRVSVSVLRSPSSSPEPFPFTELFHRDYSALFIIFVSQPRSPQPFSVHVFSSVLHPRLRNRSPSTFSALFTGFVSGTVLSPRSPSEPYRDALAASDAEVNET